MRELTERKAAATKFDGNKFLSKKENKRVSSTEKILFSCLIFVVVEELWSYLSQWFVEKTKKQQQRNLDDE